MLKTIEIYADTRGVSFCSGRACRQQILWATVVATGRKLCFDDLEEPALTTRREAATGRLVETVDLAGNHWATCRDSAAFKSRAGR